MIGLAFGGCAINYQMTLEHADVEPPGWFKAACHPEGAETFDCREVLKSKWAYFSLHRWQFVEPDTVTGGEAVLPVALAGWMYFAVLFIWYLAIGRCSFERRWWHALVAIVVMLGSLTSAYFIYVMFAHMEHKCLLCIASHAINFLLLIGTVLLWPRHKPQSATPEQSEDDQMDATVAPVVRIRPHPGGRLVLVTILCCFLAVWTQNLVFGMAKTRGELDMYKQQVARMRADTDMQISYFYGRVPQKIEVRPDDPVTEASPYAVDLVVFSDFQCPACRAFAHRLDEEILPQFDRLLRVVWKHYPICTECNPHVSRNLHPDACKLAYAAEAARLQGESEAFWKCHDFFYENQRKLPRLDYEVLAAVLKLDPDQFLADMESDRVRDRVAADLNLAKSLDVSATPSIFLGGRKVERYWLANPEFVGDMHERVKRAALVRQKRAAKQQRSGGQEAAVTQDNPDPQDER